MMTSAETGEDERLIREFIELISVVPVGDTDDRFQGITPDWGGGRVFGGVILGQAMHAALSTVPGDRRAHSMHGYFLRPARSGQPIDFAVEHVRDGRSFTTRRVSASQDGKEIFSMTCSFHADTKGDEYRIPIQDGIPGPETLPLTHKFGPIEIKELGATAAGPGGTHRSTGRHWMRVAGPMPEDPALHIPALAHLSDVTRTAARPPVLGHTDSFEGLISIDHAVWFHEPVSPTEWLFYDIHVLIHAEGRGTLRGTMHTRDGRLALSMAQEMLILPLEDISK